MALQIDCFGDSHVGQRRPANEDQFMIADLNKSMRIHQTSLGLNHQTRLFGGSQGKLLMVADGLGGHESGERASTLAVDGVTNYVLNTMDWFFKLNEDNQEEFEAELIDSFKHTQKKLIEEADAIPQRKGMATTLTMAFLDWPELYVVHVGDTRCYHISNGDIKQLTKDHTMAQLIHDSDRGASPPPTSNNKMSHVLWNVVGGMEEALEPQFLKTTMEKGDALLLSSDGLTNYVNDGEILKLVKDENTAQLACTKLIELANSRGGADNITTIVAKFVDCDDNVMVQYEEADTTPFRAPEENTGDDELVVAQP